MEANVIHGGNGRNGEKDMFKPIQFLVRPSGWRSMANKVFAYSSEPEFETTLYASGEPIDGEYNTIMGSIVVNEKFDFANKQYKVTIEEYVPKKTKAELKEEVIEAAVDFVYQYCKENQQGWFIEPLATAVNALEAVDE